MNALGDAPDVPRILVGSMKDLGDAGDRQVSYTDGVELGQSLGIPYIGKLFF